MTSNTGASFDAMFPVAMPVAKKLKVLLWGAEKVGKTTAALTFPRCVVIDTEGGTDMYANGSFRVFRTKSMREVYKAIEAIEADGGKSIDTLVIDSLTPLRQILIDAELRRVEQRQKRYNKPVEDAALTYREWGRINGEMKALYNRLTLLPVHVVVTAREATEYEQVEGKDNQMKKVGNKPDADRSLGYLFDYIVAMQPDKSGVITGRGKLPGNGKLKRVEWSAFEPFAQAMSKGETVKQKSDAQIIDDEVNDLTSPDNAREFANFWMEQGAKADDLKTALGVERVSLWTQGRDMADALMSEHMHKKRGTDAS
jgi:hypothetical protein